MSDPPLATTSINTTLPSNYGVDKEAAHDLAQALESEPPSQENTLLEVQPQRAQKIQVRVEEARPSSKKGQALTKTLRRSFENNRGWWVAGLIAVMLAVAIGVALGSR